MASSRQAYDVKALGPARYLVYGSFRPQSTGALVSADTAPSRSGDRGFSVARTGVGVNRVTFDTTWKDMEACFVSARKADGTACFVQGGDYVAASKTLDIRTMVAGSGSALVRTVHLDMTSARLQSKTKWMRLEDFRVGSTPPTLNATLFGWAFDADAEALQCNVRVPHDWETGSDMTFRIHWHGLSGDAIEDSETVEWNVTWGTINEGEAIDNGTEVVAQTIYTQSGAGTDKEYLITDVTIDHDDAGQPIAKGDMLTFRIQADATNSTYISAGGDAVFIGAELGYTAKDQLLRENDADSSQPYLQRVNGTTDPSYRIVWPAGNVDPVQLPAFVWPSTLDGTANATARLRAAVSSTNDTPTIDVQFWESQGDTEAGAATGALSDTTANVTAAIAAAGISDTPTGLPVTLVLVPGTHNTDDVHLYGAEVEFTSTDSPDAFALTDLSDDADNRISFMCIMRGTTVGGAAAT